MYRWSGQWLQEGCMKNEMESNASMTVCECNYLAHFAILISPDAEVSKHVVKHWVNAYMKEPSE